MPVVFLSKKDISYRNIIIPHIIRHKENGDTKAVRAMIFGIASVVRLKFCPKSTICFDIR